MKILFFADIVGRIGREAVKATLPDFRSEHSPDLIIGNCENLAQGKGVSARTIDEMVEAGIEFFTSGNHIWRRKEVYEILSDAKYRDIIIRPANYPKSVPGEGYKLLTVGAKSVLVVNFLGRVFSDIHTEDPFRLFDKILAENMHRNPSVILVDFHGEATSEKIAFGWHADGRASAVWGTHTHVATRDDCILPDGTGYITDVGMCGFSDGVIGVDREPILRHFMSQLPVRHELPTSGEAVVNALILEIDSNGKCSAIEHLTKQVTI